MMREATTKKNRLHRVFFFVAAALLLFALSIAAVNRLSGHRLYFWWVEACNLGFGDERVVHEQTSPDGKSRAWVTCAAWLGRTYTVYVAGRFDLVPRRIMSVGEEDAGVTTTGPVTDMLVWSKDGRYVALVMYGWYTGLYDLQGNRLEPLPVDLGPDIDMKAWGAYHDKVTKLMN